MEGGDRGGVEEESEVGLPVDDLLQWKGERRRVASPLEEVQVAVGW